MNAIIASLIYLQLYMTMQYLIKRIFPIHIGMVTYVIIYTTNVVSSNPVHGDMSEVISGYFNFPRPNKTDHHGITEILLKVALNTINHQSTYNKVSKSNLTL